MKLKELLKELNVLACTADPEADITGISYDSRITQKGDMFVAVRGFETDGHKYIPKAVEKGASVVLCEDVPTVDVPYVQIESCRKGLALASKAFFGAPASRMKIIGITGTNGKTTTSYLIKHLLEETLGAKVGLIGTNGNMIGEKFIHSERTTPESYELQKLFKEMADEGCTHVVMEVSSHSLSLDRVAGITYEVGIFSNLTQDHLDFHGTMENYADAKAILFRNCTVGCVNADDGWTEYITRDASCRLMTFSADKSDASLFADNIVLSADGVKFTARYGAECAEASLAIPGMFSVHNALGVIAAGLALGISLKECTEALSSAAGVRGRAERVPTDGDYSIIIDYSHTPDALENILQTLRPITKGRLIALFGCGGDRDRLKRPIMGRIASENSDICVVTSDNPRTEDPDAIISEILPGISDKAETVVICDRIEAIHWTIDNALPGDVILLAGKGHEDYQVIGHEKIHMDEREIVDDYLRDRKNR